MVTETKFFSAAGFLSQGTTSGFTFQNRANVHGAPDGVYGGWSVNTGDFLTIGETFAFNIPDGATITGLRFRWANDESISITATCRVHPVAGQAAIVTNTASFRNTTTGHDITGTDLAKITPEIMRNGQFHLQLTGTSSKRRLDYFGIQVQYELPAPTGPVAKVYRNGAWATVPLKRWNGTQWVNAIIKKT